MTTARARPRRRTSTFDRDGGEASVTDERKSPISKDHLDEVVRVLSQFPLEAILDDLTATMDEVPEAREDATLWIHRAEMERSLGRIAAALSSYRRVLALDPVNEDALANCGLILRDAERFAEAHDLFVRLTGARPEDRGAWIERARTAALAHRDEDAFFAFTWLVERYPDEILYVAGRAAVAYDLRRHEIAFSDLQKWVAAQPDAAYGWKLLGWEHDLRGDTASAVDAYRRAIALDDSDPTTVRELGAMLCKQRDWEGARAFLTRAESMLAGARDDQRLHAALALAYKGLGNGPEARRHAQMAMGSSAGEQEVS